MTWEYTGVQGVAGGYKGLQGVTWGYKGFDQTMEKMPILWVFQTDVFIVQKGLFAI